MTIYNLERVVIAISPKTIPVSVLKQSDRSFDLRRSGKTVTMAMLRNPPQVKGMIQAVMLSTGT